jgi:hypothetical protein
MIEGPPAVFSLAAFSHLSIPSACSPERTPQTLPKKTSKIFPENLLKLSRKNSDKSPTLTDEPPEKNVSTD